MSLTRPGFESVRSDFELTRFGFHNLPERERGSLLIRPPQLVLFCFVCCFEYTPWQHINMRSYQDRYWLRTVLSRDIFILIVLTTGRPSRWHYDPTQTHYPDVELISPTVSSLVMPITVLSSEKYQFSMSLVWLNQDSNFWPSTQEASTFTVSRNNTRITIN